MSSKSIPFPLDAPPSKQRLGTQAKENAKQGRFKAVKTKSGGAAPSEPSPPPKLAKINQISGQGTWLASHSSNSEAGNAMSLPGSTIIVKPLFCK